MRKGRVATIVLSLIAGIFLTSCSKSPQAIEYGKDHCYSCQMTIVDKIYGAEIITDKGKVYKFDAAECLIRYKGQLTESTEGYQLISNFMEEPEEFVSMKEANFLISESLPSPMGAFLTTFKTKEAVVKMQEEVGGQIYSWSELEQYFKENK